MEREIIFRGREKRGTEWFEGDLSYLIHDKKECYIFPADGYNSPDCYEVDPDTVGQYTGLTDKNGKKIFDGDLLKYTRGEDDAPYRVFWDNLGWYIQCENRMPDRLSRSQPEDWEVIGNIYDNPELLV